MASKPGPNSDEEKNPDKSPIPGSDDDFDEQEEEIRLRELMNPEKVFEQKYWALELQLEPERLVLQEPQGWQEEWQHELHKQQQQQEWERELHEQQQEREKQPVEGNSPVRVRPRQRRFSRRENVEHLDGHVSPTKKPRGSFGENISEEGTSNEERVLSPGLSNKTFGMSLHDPSEPSIYTDPSCSRVLPQAPRPPPRGIVPIMNLDLGPGGGASPNVKDAPAYMSNLMLSVDTYSPFPDVSEQETLSNPGPLSPPDFVRRQFAQLEDNQCVPTGAGDLSPTRTLSPSSSAETNTVPSPRGLDSPRGDQSPSEDSPESPVTIMNISVYFNGFSFVELPVGQSRITDDNPQAGGSGSSPPAANIDSEEGSPVPGIQEASEEASASSEPAFVHYSHSTDTSRTNYVCRVCNESLGSNPWPFTNHHCFKDCVPRRF